MLKVVNKMADWYVFKAGEYGITGDQLAQWYFSLPLIAQVMIVVLVFAVVALTLILIYYILLGIGYLIYYLLKGLYYLFKGICVLTYKLLKGIYHMIFGKGGTAVPTTEQGQQVQSAPVQAPVQYAAVPAPAIQVITKTPAIEQVASQARFCPECGMAFTTKMVEYLRANGRVYCEFCGKGFSDKTKSEVVA